MKPGKFLRTCFLEADSTDKIRPLASARISEPRLCLVRGHSNFVNIQFYSKITRHFEAVGPQLKVEPILGMSWSKNKARFEIKLPTNLHAASSLLDYGFCGH